MMVVVVVVVVAIRNLYCARVEWQWHISFVYVCLCVGMSHVGPCLLSPGS